MSLTSHQQYSFDVIVDWFFNGGYKKQQVFTFYGPAGSGKTFLLSEFSQALAKAKKSVSCATFTGKAASVMERRGMSSKTIHKLIYRPTVLSDGSVKFELDPSSPLASSDILILDEVSMVNGELGRDLESFGVPILCCGDQRNQLLPIEGESHFYRDTPDTELTEVVRQALDSPIIAAATAIRQDPSVDLRQFRNQDFGVIPRSKMDDRILLAADQVLCGMHKTRIQINKRINAVKNEGMLPTVGSKILITRNNDELGLMNGETAWVESIEYFDLNQTIKLVESRMDKADNEKHHKKGKQALAYLRSSTATPRFFKATIRKDGEVKTIDVYIMVAEFEKDWTMQKTPTDVWRADEAIYSVLNACYAQYGYAVSVHKAQGSEWPKVLMVDDGFGSWGDDSWDTRRRWLYTGVTRASEKFVMVK